MAMLPYAKLITKFTRNEILALIKQSKLVCRYPELDIKSRKSSQSWGRILIITPKKMGNAPQRNKARRRLRAIFYQERLFERNADLVIFCKAGINNIEFKKLREILISCVC